MLFLVLGQAITHTNTSNPNIDLLPLTDELRQSISSILDAIDNVQERLVRIEMATEGLTASFDQMVSSYEDRED